MKQKEYVCDCVAVHQEAVEKTKKELPEGALLEEMASFFKIIGDQTRCRILAALQLGELCVCDLANVLGMSKSAVSHQLAKLRQVGAVKCRRQGKEVFYSPDDEHIAALFALTMTHIRHKKEGGR